MAADCRIWKQREKKLDLKQSPPRSCVGHDNLKNSKFSKFLSSNDQGFGGRTRINKWPKLSKSLAVLIVLLFYEVTPSCSLFLNCASVKNCICDKADDEGWRIECPNETRFQYPIELKVQKLDSNNNFEASLSIQCDENESSNPWSYIKGMDLSDHEVYAKIVRLEIKYCPPVQDGWSELLKELNLTGTDIRRFSFMKEDRSDSAQPVEIPPNFFDNMPNIEILNLRNNKLTSIPNLPLKKLISLNLRNNDLREIPADAFSQNTQLTSIALTKNNLTEIAPGTFPDSVEHLELNQNEISYLNSSTFANLKKLKRLFLNSNPLDNISPDTFDDMTALEELLIYNSKMTQFPNLKNLEKLVNLTISTAIRFDYLPSLAGPEITTTLAPDYLPENTLVLKDLPSLENVILPLNHFNSLPVFQNLPKLVSIDLKRNEITEVESGAFSGLPSLKIINMSRNKIRRLGTIKAPSLVELDVSRNLLTELRNDTFVFLNSLKKLFLSRNQISTIFHKTFEPLSSLEEIDLSYNKVTFSSSPSPFAGVPINDDYNFFGDVSNQSPLRWSVRLRRLLLSHNAISKLGFSDWTQVFTQINEIDLSFNQIQRVSANELNFISSNLTLNLENNEISVVDLQWRVVLEDNSSGLKEVRVLLSNNPIHCDCHAYTLKKFASESYKLKINNVNCSNPPDLIGKKLIDISDDKFLCDMEKEAGCPEPCKCKERVADKTILVDCSSLNLTTDEIPRLDTFRKYYAKWMIELDLSDNEITDFNNTNYIKQFLNKTRLVDLSENKLTSTSFLEKVGAHQPTTFSLASNPFPCSNCIGFQFPWRAFPTRINDLANVTCRRDRETSYFSSEPSEMQKDDLAYVLENRKEFETLCASQKLSVFIILPLVIAVIFLLCLCIGLFVTIRYGWTIKAYLYSKGWDWCLFWERDLDADEEAEGNEKMYDAFVSYSHKDEEWVLDELVNKLETQEGFKLCLHFRDWTPGDWIPDQIVRSVDKSRRTIVVLSKNFVESVWSRLEFKAAHAQALKERSNRVILILLGEDLKESDVNDDDLKMYMKMNTFMKWNDPLFWHRLKYALPHKKPSDQGCQNAADAEQKQNAINKIQQRERAIKLDKLRAKLEQNV